MSNSRHQQKPRSEDKQWRMQLRNLLSLRSPVKTKNKQTKEPKPNKGGDGRGWAKLSRSCAGVSRAAPAHPGRQREPCFCSTDFLQALRADDAASSFTKHSTVSRQLWTCLHSTFLLWTYPQSCLLCMVQLWGAGGSSAEQPFRAPTHHQQLL